MSIHPLAYVSSKASIAAAVELGPFCVIESEVRIGSGCRLSGHVTIKSGVELGENNTIGEGTVIGGAPQHTSAPAQCGRLMIGNNNVIREHATLHRALKESATTIIGNHNYIMVNAHIGHDCVLGDNNVLVNNVMLGGHVHIGDRVNLGGAAGVHQFCRIGSMAMIGGQAHVIQDVPPFVTVDGLTSRIVGLNLIGLRRNGCSPEDIRQIKAQYRILYRSGRTWKEILAILQAEYSVGRPGELTEFLLTTKRGIVSERRSGSGRPALRVIEAEDVDNEDLEEEIRPFRANVG
jgi:UDP-N-acetylglucosamine acyltransferase